MVLAELEFFSESIFLNPNDKDAWNYKDISLHSLGKYRELIKCFDTVLILKS